LSWRIAFSSAKRFFVLVDTFFVSFLLGLPTCIDWKTFFVRKSTSISGSILKPRHSASGSFTRKNINEFVVGVHVPMCSRALLKLETTDCFEIAVLSSGTRASEPMGKILHSYKTVSSHNYFYINQRILQFTCLHDCCRPSELFIANSTRNNIMSKRPYTRRSYGEHE